MQIHITESVKHAAAFAAIGAELLEADQVIRDGRTQAVFTLRDSAPIPLAKAEKLFTGSDEQRLSTLADEIIERRGLTPDEAATIGLDYARAALHNRGTFLHSALSRAPLAKIQIPGRGQFIYRTDQTREQKREFIKKAL
jgi:hypothetical protein